MTFKPTLSPQQTQRLVLTPQLRQRIEMLQMTVLELSELVTQQLNENPILDELQPEEVSGVPDQANVDYAETPASLSNGSDLSGELPAGGAESFDSTPPAILEKNEFGPGPGDSSREVEGAEPREPEIGERDSFEEIDYGPTFEEYLDPGYRTRETEVKEAPSIEQYISSEQNLAEYLNWQLRITMTSPEVRDAAEEIIGNLNDDGFLDGTLEEIATLGGWTLETVERALGIVQQFDPTGVGAQDLQECLLLQLDYYGY